MEPNVGGRDRTARLVIGALLVASAAGTALGLVPVPETVRLPLAAVDLLVGDALLASALLRRSLLNRAFDIDTTTNGTGSDAGVSG